MLFVSLVVLLLLLLQRSRQTKNQELQGSDSARSSTTTLLLIILIHIIIMIIIMLIIILLRIISSRDGIPGPIGQTQEAWTQRLSVCGFLRTRMDRTRLLLRGLSCFQKLPEQQHIIIFLCQVDIV